MLVEVLIEGAASYGREPQKLGPCKAINFIFGTNGSGKTTISRVIANPAAHEKCRLVWQAGREVERLVYNADFAAKNYKPEMPGIFTLGEGSTETRNQIEEKNRQRDRIQSDIAKISINLNGGGNSKCKSTELKELRIQLEEKCWSMKTHHARNFKYAFEGFQKSKSRFCDKVLSELDQNNGSTQNLERLVERANVVYKKGLRPIPEFEFHYDDLLARLEKHPILCKRIVGKEDVDLASLINVLGNADWVRQGRPYLERSSPACPFCQQQLLAGFHAEIDAYFDDTYAKNTAAVLQLQSEYEAKSAQIVSSLQAIASSKSELLDIAGLEALLQRLIGRIEANKRQIDRKRSEPSLVVALEPADDVLKQIAETIEKANVSVRRHNELVRNQAAERTRLTQDIWRFVLNELKSVLDEHNKLQYGLEKAIAGLEQKLRQLQDELSAVKREIFALEESITSVQPTVNEINGILRSFGFHNFSLATAGAKHDLYRIVRSDGSDATRSLSEGEKTFITFLYFCHLVRGSVSSAGVTTDRVVVFDDPISSLDGDVLFVVSSLVRKILEEARAGSSQIKQVFILTHNVYFHKEVTFDPKRTKEARCDETFWIIRKRSQDSLIEGYSYNPIKTSYELLWSEIRNKNRSNITIQNTIRRIIEHYFTKLGNINKNSIIEEFEGHDKQICASFFSWVNDGSHDVHDDIYISPDDTVVDRYLVVFKEIFIKMKHRSHYDMMMGSAASGETAPDNVRENSVMKGDAA